MHLEIISLFQELRMGVDRVGQPHDAGQVRNGNRNGNLTKSQDSQDSAQKSLAEVRLIYATYI